MPRGRAGTKVAGLFSAPRAAKARALLTGATHVTPEHVRDAAKPVLRHRVMLNFNAEADMVPSDAIIDALVKETPVESAGAGESRLMDAGLRK